MVRFDALKPFPQIIHPFSTESGLWTGSAQIFHPHLQPEGYRSARHLAFAAQREPGRHHRSKLSPLYGSCDIGYHWTGRSGHVHDRTVPSLINDGHAGFDYEFDSLQSKRDELSITFNSLVSGGRKSTFRWTIRPVLMTFAPTLLKLVRDSFLMSGKP